jgi:ribosomal protein S12 methylthiotransferase accessory factor YcaO
MLLDKFWNRLLDRLLREERGDGIISWVVLAVGLAAAAAAVIAILRPAITNAAQSIVNLISGG